MRNYIYDPCTPKELAYSKKVKCAYPNCQCDAINSHLLQKNRWLRDIAEDGKVLQLNDEHLQSMIDGDENGNNYTILSIHKALSLPIYCALHDQKLFKDFEVKDLDLTNKLHLLKLSYRAFCAELAKENRRNVFYKINPDVNSFIKGDCFDVQLRYSNYVVGEFEKYRNVLYSHIKNKDVTNYDFSVLSVPRVPICLSDVIIQEDELYASYVEHKGESVFPIFIHMMPYDDKSVLILGFDKTHCCKSIISRIEKWKNYKGSKKELHNILGRTNNWCVAPSFFGDDPTELCVELTCMKFMSILTHSVKNS